MSGVRGSPGDNALLQAVIDTSQHSADAGNDFLNLLGHPSNSQADDETGASGENGFNFNLFGAGGGEEEADNGFAFNFSAQNEDNSEAAGTNFFGF